MDPTQPILKLFCRGESPPPGELIGVFHKWIQQQRFGNQLLLFDVADYSHVEQGPGVLLVAQECYLGLGEQEGGGMGLLYRQRRGPDRSAGEGLRAGLAILLQAAVLLEQDLAGLQFDPAQLLVGFDDQLAAPNTAATSAALEPTIRAFAEPLYPEGVHLSAAGTAVGSYRTRLGAVRAPPSLTVMQQRLSDG